MASHSWGKRRTECERCGIYSREFDNTLPHPRCTGDAYICRVARKLLHLAPYGLIEYIEPVLSPVGLHWDTELTSATAEFTRKKMVPWQMTAGLLCMAIDFILNVHAIETNPTIHGLRVAIRSDPKRCPILADSLEEAGCERLILEALRTP
jgi:hypothetical protein